MGLNDTAWETLFERYDILRHIQQHGHYEIDADTIKTVREPRLMAKFDHKTNLPEVFRKNGLSILPVSRSRYVIGEFEAYQTVSYNTHIAPTSISLPPCLTSIEADNIYSESVALHCAYASGMIHDLIGVSSLPTISGRMSSGEFEYTIHRRDKSPYSVSIENSQVEIDGGYETENELLLFEVKKETINDFLIRQLYYPYRLWHDKLGKDVIPIFFTHSNDIFSFFIYKFTDVQGYNSLQLVQQKDYVIAHEDIEFTDITDILYSVKTVPEPKVPFPQADSFARIVDLLGLLMENDLERNAITENYNFNKRQTNYYTRGGMYLGLIERFVRADRSVWFRLTDRGRSIMRKPYKAKYLSLASCILEHEVFARVMTVYIHYTSKPERPQVMNLMKLCHLYHVDAEETYFRRSQTVLKWVEWIMDLPNV